MAGRSDLILAFFMKNHKILISHNFDLESILDDPRSYFSLKNDLEICIQMYEELYESARR